MKGWLFETFLWSLRLAIVAMLVLVVWLGYRRTHKSDEQLELGRYVEHEVPALAEAEVEVLTRLRRLSARPGPTPEEARSLLVGDLIPRLIQLRKRAASVEAHTATTGALRDEYLRWIDKLLDACRASVRAIDAPPAPAATSGSAPDAGLPAASGGAADAGLPAVDDAARTAAELRRRFAEADAAARRWSEDVRAACVRHQLAPPPHGVP